MTTLTREAIEAASGRELDALCAQYLMGWTALVDRGHYYDGFAPNTENSIFNLAFVPAYSTSGDAMLSVLEKMAELRWLVSAGMNHHLMIETSSPLPGCSFLSVERNIHERSNAVTLPEAVAKAALLAILSQKTSV